MESSLSLFLWRGILVGAVVATVSIVALLLVSAYIDHQRTKRGK